MITKTQIPGVYMEKRKFKDYYTINLTPGKQTYMEKLVKQEDKEFREWDPKRSKLGAAIAKNIRDIGFRDGDIVLYLGAASGTTVSHVSDIVGKSGAVFALEFAPRVTKDLVFLAEERKNIIPILADCNHPENYADKIMQADFIFQDIAQRNQTEIFLKNLQFLKKDGIAMLVLKARSVDMAKHPKDVFREVEKELEDKVRILEYLELYPFEKDHCLFVVERK